jgi:AraC-like DNA-binding protein/quercetin dioxygenase-like cupin family protein
MENNPKQASVPVTTHHIQPTPVQKVAFRLVNVKTYLESHQQFPDHRHGFFELIFIGTGSGTHTIDFVEYLIQPNTLFLMSPGQVHNFRNGHIEEGFVLIFDRDYLAQHQNDTELLMRIVACGLQSPQIPILENESTHLRHCRDLIHDELHQISPDYELIRSALKIMLIKALKFGQQQIEQSVSEAGIHKKRYFDFLLLIESHHTQRHEVAFYAEKLMISPKQLTVITRLLSGKTALQTIHDRVLTEAKRLLFYSELSVKEIAVALGFEDASYFSRFFVQKTGTTPKEFQLRNPKSAG